MSTRRGKELLSVNNEFSIFDSGGSLVEEINYFGYAQQMNVCCCSNEKREEKKNFLYSFGVALILTHQNPRFTNENKKELTHTHCK